MNEVAVKASSGGRYTVEHRGGCTIIYGEVPILELSRLMSGQTDTTVIASHLAQMLGAMIAWGEASDVDALTETVRQERLRQVPVTTQASTLSHDARRWLAVGEQGLSSSSIFWRLTGFKPDYLRDKSGYPHPHDVGDLRRCLLLLNEVPEFAGRIGEMAGCSAEWDRLVANWGVLVDQFMSEIGDLMRPKQNTLYETHALLRSILDDTIQESQSEQVD